MNFMSSPHSIDSLQRPKSPSVLHIAPGLEKDSIKRYVEQLVGSLRKLDGVYDQDIFYLDKSKPFSSYSKMLKYVRHKKPDIVHIQHEFGMFDTYQGLSFLIFYPWFRLYCRVNGIKTVLTLHTIPDKREMAEIGYPGAVKGVITKFLPPVYFFVNLYALCSLSDANIALTEPARSVLEKRYMIKHSKAHFIPNGIMRFDLSVRKEIVASFKKAYGLAGKKIISLVGFAFRLKGYHFLINALPSVVNREQNAVVVITGGTLTPMGKAYLESLKRLAKELSVSDHIIFTGYLKDVELRALLNITDLYVFPYSYKVGDSAAVNLAINTGRPILVSNIPAFADIIENKLATSMDPSDKEELSSLIVKYLERPPRRVSKRRLDDYFKRNSMETAAMLHLKLYESLLKR
ncbi:MAG: glycosyltransferase [Candidatus Micrarchaeales archaeon]|nr:glycosyltransferase [Candidatus Micrarchaeales archaeon]